MVNGRKNVYINILYMKVEICCVHPKLCLHITNKCSISMSKMTNAEK